MDLRAAVLDSFDRLQESGKIREIVDKHVEKALDDSIKSTIGSYSDFQKQIEKMLKEKLDIKPDAFEITRYNEMITSILKERVAQFTIAQGTDHFNKLIEDVFKNPPVEIKLSKMVEDMLEENEEDAQEAGREEATVLIEDTDYGTKWVHLDPEPHKKKYDCKYQFSISKDGTTFGVKLRDWGGDNSFKQTMFVRKFRGMERMMFWLHAEKTKVILDVDESSVSTRYKWANY